MPLRRPAGHCHGSSTGHVPGLPAVTALLVRLCAWLWPAQAAVLDSVEALVSEPSGPRGSGAGFSGEHSAGVRILQTDLDTEPETVRWGRAPRANQISVRVYWVKEKALESGHLMKSQQGTAFVFTNVIYLLREHHPDTMPRMGARDSMLRGQMPAASLPCHLPGCKGQHSTC